LHLSTPQAFRVYYLHKAAVSLVALVTRRMPKRSSAVEQMRIMLQGSLLTWSVWLTAAYLSDTYLSLTEGTKP
jgi:hypothetical protein